MPWKEVSPGHYERDFDSLENFYRVVADAAVPLNRQHYLISCTLQLATLPPLHVIKNAWKILRQKYPQIAATGTGHGTGAKFCYDVPQPDELDAWVKDTLIIENQSSANDKYEKEKPSSEFLLYCFPDTRGLLLRMPHWRIDGIGLMYLQNAFLQILANGASDEILLDGSEAKNLTLSLDEAAGVPASTSSADSQAATDELDVFLKNQPSISIPTLPNVLPNNTRRLQSSFPADITSRIIDACKSRNLTVTTAVHAALVVATFPYMEHGFDPTTRGQGGGKYTGFNAIDLRKYLSAPFNGPEAAVSIYHTGIPVSVDLTINKDFDSIAAEMLTSYKRDLSKDSPRNLFNFLAEYVNQVLGVLGQEPGNPLHAPAHPELSSMGIINEHVSAKYEGTESTIEVQEWWIAVEVINRLLLTNVWTWNEEMVLSVNWNEAFYDDEFVSQFLEQWKETVCKSLGVE
ncbi:hypothetical protein N7528_005271 [Penicillium herquei]|nr:hypothetical protein N7528_005271 [Penicillium herquei]